MDTSIKLKHLVIAVGVFILYVAYSDHQLLYRIADFLASKG